MDARGVIVLLALASAVSGAALRAVEPMLPALAAEFGASISLTASVITAFAVAYGVANLVHGPLGDHFGKLRYLTWVLACAGAASIGCAFAGGVASLAAMRFATGMFASASVTLGMAYIGDTVPRGELQPVVARFVSGTIVGQALGPVIGGALADLVGWRGAFVAIGLCFVIVAAALARQGRERRPHAAAAGMPNPFARYREVLPLRPARYILAVTFIETFLFFGAFAFLGPMLQERFALSLTATGLILAGFGLGGLLYTTSVKWLLGKLRQQGLVLAGGLVACGCYLSLAVLPLWQPSFVLAAGLGLGFFMMHNTLQVKATEMAPAARGTALSAYSSFWSLGQAAGVAAMGLVVSRFEYAAPIVACGIGFAALGWWLRANLERLST